MSTVTIRPPTVKSVTAVAAWRQRCLDFINTIKQPSTILGLLRDVPQGDPDERMAALLEVLHQVGYSPLVKDPAADVRSVFQAGHRAVEDGLPLLLVRQAVSTFEALCATGGGIEDGDVLVLASLGDKKRVAYDDAGALGFAAPTVTAPYDALPATHRLRGFLREDECWMFGDVPTLVLCPAIIDVLGWPHAPLYVSNVLVVNQTRHARASQLAVAAEKKRIEAAEEHMRRLAQQQQPVTRGEVEELQKRLAETAAKLSALSEGAVE